MSSSYWCSSYRILALIQTVRIPPRRGVLDTTLCEKFISDLRQVGGCLRVLRFPPPIKLNVTIQLKYC